MTSTLPPIVQAFSGAIGSATANSLTYPLDLLTTRLQLESPGRSKIRGLYGARLIFRQILNKYGWRAFYDGIYVDTYATLLSNFFYFYFYAFLRLLSTRRLISFTSRSKSSSIHKPSMIEELVLGYVAGIASRVVATPLNIVTLRLQTERSDGGDNNEVNLPSQKTGIMAVVKNIYREQGLAGFWRGFQMSALLALNPSITLAFFQMFGRLLALAKSSRFGALRAGKLSLKEAPVNANLNPWEAFFGAAIANSIAVSVLYPLILAKKRLQMSSSATIREVLVDAYSGNSYPPNGNSKDIENGQTSEDQGTGHLQGLYQGYQMKIITGFLSQGVTFLVKGSFSAAFALALPVLAAATAISLSARQSGNCDTGSTLCYNSAQESDSTSVSELAGLLGIVLPDIAGLIGLGCSPLSILGFGGNSCSAQPVCCIDNTFSGLIAFGCNPVNIDL